MFFIYILLISCGHKVNTNNVLHVNPILDLDSLIIDKNIKSISDLNITNRHNGFTLSILDNISNIVISYNFSDNDTKLSKFKLPTSNNNSQLINSIIDIDSNNVILIYNSITDTLNKFQFIKKNKSSSKIDSIYYANTKRFYLFTDFSFEFSTNIYDSCTNSIFLRSSQLDTHKTMNFISRLDLSTNKISTIPFKYPVNTKPFAHLVISQAIYYTIHNNKIIVSFPFDKSLYIYDIENKETTKKECSTDREHNIYTPSIEEIQEHPYLQQDCYTYSFRYTAIIYNQFKNHYIRFYELGQDFKKNDSTYNNIDDKKFGITIYNENFICIGDTIIGNIGKHKPFYRTATATENGIVLFCSYNWENHYLKYLTIKYKEDE